MKSRRAVESLGALAHGHRLAVYRLLVRHGPRGLPAGNIGQRVGLTPSSLTFHLQSLERAGLIRRTRVSRHLYYSADFEAMSALVGYLTDECCAEESTGDAGCGPGPAGRKSKGAGAA
jgi:DNA-binding transcriptional ArsR family regulator